MSPPILYISRLLPDPVMAAARQQFQLFNEPRDIAPSWETFKAGLREADAAICTLTDRVDTALLAEPTRLKILANYAVGYNNIDLAAATAKGIVVTNTPDVLTDSTADLTCALILALAWPGIVGITLGNLLTRVVLLGVDEPARHAFQGLVPDERRGRVSAAELLEEAIARTEKVDPQLNAVVVKHYDFARKHIEKGLPDGPFRGVPFLLKDLNLLGGTRTTFGASLNKAYVADHTDTLTQRFVDAWMSFPDLIILIVVVSVVGPGMPQIIGTLGLLLGIAGSRIIRSAVVSVRENMYVHAAQSIGASTARILWRHLLPNIMPPIIVLFTTRVGAVILAESGLSFLGLGVPPPAPTWGGLLSGSGRTYMFQGPWLALAPGICLTVVVYATNVFGDALRDLLDPRMRGSK